MGHSNSKKRSLKEEKNGYIQEEKFQVIFEKKQDLRGTFDPNDEQAQLDLKASLIKLKDYEYPFENIAFEGGGSKGVAYCGAIEVLEELGIRQNIRRVAGTSAGAITAALFSVGYPSDQLKELMAVNLVPKAIDHKWGFLSLLPSLYRNYGWNSAQKLVKWLGDTLDNQTRKKGVTDVTFDQICITATNVNMMSVEYFHPKTTPNVKIKEAVRMSMSMPALFIPTKMQLNEKEDIFVDGGVLCNYPVSCFDGWWLSMEKGDCFFERMHPLHILPTLFEKRERFGTYNDKTLGFLLYSDNEDDFFREKFDRRKGIELTEYPNTKLGVAAKMKRAARQKKNKKLVEHSQANRAAVEAFLNVLRKHNSNQDDEIDIEELRAALNDDEFTDGYMTSLFGENTTAEDVMAKIDVDNDGKIQYYELDRFLGSVGQSLQSQFLGHQRTDIKSFKSFMEAVQETLVKNAQRLFVEDHDFERTVGINVGYIETTNFVMEPDDREYLYKRGKVSTEVFLKYYAAQHDLPRKGEKLSTYL